MDINIPYQAGMLMGRYVDLRTLTMGYLLSGSEMNPQAHEVNLSTLQFSLVNSLRDLCNVLSVPPEYVLKVKAKLLKNEAVSSCLKGLGDKECCTLIFRGTFLHSKQYLPFNSVPLRAKLEKNCGDGTIFSMEGHHDPSPESLIADAIEEKAVEEIGGQAISGQDMGYGETGQAISGHGMGYGETGGQAISVQDMKGVESGDHHTEGASRAVCRGTHWVKALEIGNEMIVIMRLTCSDEAKFSKQYWKLRRVLGAYLGLLDSAKLQELKKFTTKLDKNLSEAHYKDMELEIKYCLFHSLDSYPASASGMVQVLETFSDQCVGWTQSCKNGNTYPLEACLMMCHVGDFQQKTSVGNVWKKFLTEKIPWVKVTSQKQEVKFQHQAADEDDDFVILEQSLSKYFYNIRVTLQPFDGDVSEADQSSSLTSLFQIQYPEATYNLYESLNSLLSACFLAERRLQIFLCSKRFNMETRMTEGKQTLKTLQSTQLKLYDVIHELDMVTAPDSSTLDNILLSEPKEAVDRFIESVTSKLPPGGNIDLLMVGKTGHGKSSTGNSILGHEKFVWSADSESMTSKTSVGWSEIDKRNIKVVDTPGVCDTNLTTNEDSHDLAIRSISEAIANCPEGFHALLLIIRFGIRMTEEEKKAIGLLKCVLGEDIVRSHCVCVITFGDNFDTEMASKPDKTTFEDWCRTQRGFLKELFLECNYRCVLFNNKAADPQVKKTQLINLIARVDSLKGCGTRYTNAIFEFAQRERERIQHEEQMPVISEEVMRDLQLVLEHLNNMVHDTDQNNRFQNELNNLKTRVDSLNSHLSEIETNQMSDLMETVFSLAATIHAKIDDIPDTPDNLEGTAASTMLGDNEDTTPTSLNKQLESTRNQLQTCMDQQVVPQNEVMVNKVADSVDKEVKENSSCFPGTSVVCLSDGRLVPLKELQVCQKVLVRNTKGQLAFDFVYMFGHRDSDEYREFIVFESQVGEVSVSSDHYVYCERDGKEQCLTAENIRAGDKLLTLISSEVVGLTSLEVAGLRSSPVISVRVERKKGLFAPFTMEGTVLVDGALMSCYVKSVTPGMAHILLGPVRQLYRLSPSLLSLINGLGQKGGEKSTVPWWATCILTVLKSKRGLPAL